MSSLVSRLSALILVLAFAGVTACSAGDRANSTLPTPAVDAPMVSANGEQTAVIAGGRPRDTPEAQRGLQNTNWSAPARPVMRSR